MSNIQKTIIAMYLMWILEKVPFTVKRTLFVQAVVVMKYNSCNQVVKHVQSGNRTSIFLCVLDIDECASTPGSPFCQNGGSCMNTVGSFSCRCDVGFTGSQCQTGAPPLLRVELVLSTFGFDARSHDSQLSALTVYT